MPTQDEGGWRLTFASSPAPGNRLGAGYDIHIHERRNMLTIRTHTKTLARIEADDLPTVSQAREAWSAVRTEVGLSPNHTPNLLGLGLNAKASKNPVPTFTLSLAPHRSSGVMNSCTNSTRECIKACVATAGNGSFPSVVAGRLARSKFLAGHPAAFLSLIRHELDLGSQRFPEVAVRLNTFSDLPWENAAPWMFEGRSNVQFYDYTKNWARLDLPDNYHLTYSVTHLTTPEQMMDRLDAGYNVAVVADRSRGQRKGEAGKSWRGYAVIDGDCTDMRSEDKRGVIVHLAPKGSAGPLPRGGFVKPFSFFDA